MNAKGHSYIAVTYLKSTNPRSYIVTFAHKGHFNTMVDMKNIHIYNNIHVCYLFRVSLKSIYQKISGPMIINGVFCEHKMKKLYKYSQNIIEKYGGLEITTLRVLSMYYIPFIKFSSKSRTQYRFPWISA